LGKGKRFPNFLSPPGEKTLLLQKDREEGKKKIYLAPPCLGTFASFRKKSVILSVIKKKKG